NVPLIFLGSTLMAGVLVLVMQAASSVFSSDFSILYRFTTLMGLVALGAAVFAGFCQLSRVVTVSELRKLLSKQS
ncbi:MAG: hypothetical protein ACR2OR_14160, partial [Hyphomicrobiales bacterium]